MKLIITIMILLAVLSNFSFAKDNKTSHYNERLCKVFTLKAELYEKHMRKDPYAITTLESYKERAKKFCTK
jgi:hypothetical protein